MITSLALQLVTMICGLILPRAILGAFGSDTNGLISSATQFLGYIVLLEAGVGGVTRAALYKPIADKNYSKVNGILNATEKFFRKIAYIFLGYAFVLAAVFPYIVNSQKSWEFISTLVLVISISTFTQYYFGITYSVYLQADQRMYVSNLTQLVTAVLNTVLSLVLIKLGANIQIVKLGTAFVFFLRPLILNLYVKKKYPINLKCEPDNGAIKDRWNGLGHHIAFFLHSNTDIFVLTLFLSTKEVSVYSVYFLVMSGVEKLVTVFSSGCEAGFGNIIAKNEKDTLLKTFRLYEMIVSCVTIIMFMTAARLTLPFVSLYTKNITDVNYIRPALMIAMVAVETVYCFRIPYQSVTLAAGHYKQTRNGAFAEAGINIVLSLILVNFFGSVGVVIATLCAMIFRTLQYTIYLNKNILKINFSGFIKRCAVNLLIIGVIALVNYFFPEKAIANYLEFFIKGFVTLAATAAGTLAINFVFYKKETIALFVKLKKMIIKK